MTEFISVFQLSRTIIFNVEFYTLGNNGSPHFTTSAGEFARNKKDFRQCGQAQEALTKKFPAAYTFYKKWDAHHLENLTQAQYREMCADLQKLKETYNYRLVALDESARPYYAHFSFYDLAEWTKQPPKKTGGK